MIVAVATKKRKTKATVARSRFAWKPGRRFHIKAAVAAAELERIRSGNGGGLTPSTVVEAARDPDNPLHREFEWNNSVAAQKYREHQARELINSVRVVVSSTGGGEERQVMFVSITTSDAGRSYLPTSVVMADTGYRDQAVSEALMALEGWQRRYGHLSELADVFTAARRARSKINRRLVRKAA